MDSPRPLSTDPVSPGSPNTSETHNASVDQDAAREGFCAQVHLPSGRMCTLPHGHEGSCEFLSGEAADAARAHLQAVRGR
jgi:hypothetical protein